MKLRFYVDVWPGMDVVRYSVTATTMPYSKCSVKDSKRIGFDVDIPDEFLGVDVMLEEVTDVREEQT